MIRKINKIANFASFKDFIWDNSIPDFRRHNLLYGWNYSGKTTIARVFRCFEIGEKHVDYPQAEFQIIDDNGKKYDHSILNQLSNIRVFNVDFVHDNLRWFEAESEIEPILILGKENISLQTRLEAIGNEISTMKEERGVLTTEKDNLNDNLENDYSEKAKHVKQVLVIPDYDKRHLRPKIDEIRNDCAPYLLSNEDYRKCFEIYHNKDKKESIQILLLPSLIFHELQQRLKSKVENKVAAQRVIEKLRNDSKLNAWVKEGKILHEGEKVCQFCGNPLPEDLFYRLNQHFSDEYTKLETDINELLNDIEKHKKELLDYLLNLPDKARLYYELSGQYEKVKKDLQDKIFDYNISLDNLSKELMNKKSNPFTEQPLKNTLDLSTEVGIISTDFNKIIEAHNNKTDNFAANQEEAKNKLIYHFAAEFINEKNLLLLTERLETLRQQIQAKTNLIEDKEIEKSSIARELSDSSKGAERVNEYIQQFFQHDGIRLEVTAHDKFLLIRNGTAARNLSEGEKTVISLAYFIAKLEGRDTKIEETIVFVDDPVSSLDSNHLFNIYSLIKSKLNNCLQLFVSTHNMDFFNLMKEFLRDNNYKNNLPCYLVQREWNKTVNRSVIKDLPEVLKQYHSEYAYLFKLLADFNQSNEATLDDYQCLYLMPNVPSLEI